MKAKIMIALLLSAGTAGAIALPATAQAQASSRCDQEQTPARSARRSVFGSVASGVLGRVVGSSSAGRVVSSFVPVSSMLSDALMDMLDCGEQRKAADATEQLTERAERGARVGESVQWESETRPGVSGRSVITAVDRPPATAQGRRCMTVTDIVIVDGEETRVPKRMCRTPPETRWARAQA